MSPSVDQLSRPAKTRPAVPRRILIAGLVAVVVLAAVSVAAPRFLAARHQDDLSAIGQLVQSIDLPAPAAEGCETDQGLRCWTTPREGRASIEGLVAILGGAGATDLTERCNEPVPQLTVPSCSVTGWYRGEVVTISSDPILSIGPPLDSEGATLWLRTTAE